MSDEAVVFKVGDAVRLRSYVLKSAQYKEISPRLLIGIGWPNEFYIERIAESTEEGPAISLSACCCNLVYKGQYRCKYHPAHLFEKIEDDAHIERIRPAPERESESRPGTRTSSILTPLGEVASVHYTEDETDPSLVMKVFGKRFELNGAFTRHIFSLAKEKGIL